MASNNVKKLQGHVSNLEFNPRGSSPYWRVVIQENQDSGLRLSWDVDAVYLSTGAHRFCGCSLKAHFPNTPTLTATHSRSVTAVMPRWMSGSEPRCSLPADLMLGKQRLPLALALGQRASAWDLCQFDFIERMLKCHQCRFACCYTYTRVWCWKLQSNSGNFASVVCKTLTNWHDQILLGCRRPCWTQV